MYQFRTGLMNKLNDLFLPDDYGKVKTERSNVTFYNNVAQCVLHFNDGRYKIVSGTEAGELLAVNVVKYDKTGLDLVEQVLKHYKYAVSIDDLSERCGYGSTKTFTRHFKQKFHVTPKQWLLLIKKNELLHYLEHTDIAFGKIASITGFNGVSHLYSFCRNKIGSSPTEIRREAVKLQAVSKTLLSSNNT